MVIDKFWYTNVLTLLLLYRKTRWNTICKKGVVLVTKVLAVKI